MVSKNVEQKSELELLTDQIAERFESARLAKIRDRAAVLATKELHRRALEAERQSVSYWSKQAEAQGVQLLAEVDGWGGNPGVVNLAVSRPFFVNEDGIHFVNEDGPHPVCGRVVPTADGFAVKVGSSWKPVSVAVSRGVRLSSTERAQAVVRALGDAGLRFGPPVSYGPSDKRETVSTATLFARCVLGVDPAQDSILPAGSMGPLADCRPERVPVSTAEKQRLGEVLSRQPRAVR